MNHATFDLLCLVYWILSTVCATNRVLSKEQDSLFITGSHFEDFSRPNLLFSWAELSGLSIGGISIDGKDDPLNNNWSRML